MQGSDGSIKIAAAAGSALQPVAVMLLEAANLEELATSKAEDWQVVEKSAGFEARPALLPLFRVLVVALLLLAVRLLLPARLLLLLLLVLLVLLLGWQGCSQCGSGLEVSA